ncbi:hypothetical protein ONZ43_g2839 [Nemania bipapillata]|uniref:Uncharacterized protein n=1 Tax=Nemania bipapillata TaxID=110536 RepID=A0ACC2IZ13_9PEZI|nr:hypothetical protein ONZ43_g2839 [Nemania bipapillata]
MAGVTNVVSTEKWGEETEKHMDVDSWRKQIYLDTIPWEHSRFRELLEKYSGIPQDQVTAEIFKIRAKAWEVAKYPCIGSLTYVRLLEFRDDNPEMRTVIDRMKAPGSEEAFLDIGGFIFQTIRRLAFEGVDSARLYGTDLHAEFIELGYEQFRDRETLKATFVAGDMLLPDDEYASSALAKTLAGQISIVHAANFFHLFSWETQLVICERIIQFLRRGPGARGPAMILGSHLGSLKPGKTEFFGAFLHDETTFQSLWDEVGKKTGTCWKVNLRVVSSEAPKLNVFGDDTRAVRYVVTELAPEI